MLAATGSLSGTARLDGTPLADTIIIASPANGLSSNFFVTTGPDGSFAFDSLTPDRYGISRSLSATAVTSTSARSTSSSVSARRSTSTQRRAPGSSKITVKTDAGEAVKAAKVAALGVRVDAPNMAALRYGALLPSLSPDGPPVPFYTRNAPRRDSPAWTT